MTLRIVLARAAVALGLAALVGCSPSSRSAGAPPSPEMPADWTIVQDVDFAPRDIEPIARQLGAELDALRNTVYTVSGKRVQLNTVVAATHADAIAVMAAMRELKPEEWLVQRGLNVYEFVGADDVRAEVLQARELLLAG